MAALQLQDWFAVEERLAAEQGGMLLEGLGDMTVQTGARHGEGCGSFDSSSGQGTAIRHAVGLSLDAVCDAPPPLMSWGDDGDATRKFAPAITYHFTPVLPFERRAMVSGCAWFQSRQRPVTRRSQNASLCRLSRHFCAALCCIGTRCERYHDDSFARWAARRAALHTRISRSSI
jgi:hypothetical protein